jgi:hypothetical protein
MRSARQHGDFAARADFSMGASTTIKLIWARLQANVLIQVKKRPLAGPVGGLWEPESLQSVPINRIEDKLTVLFKYSFDSH